jgi:hypothetical protein
MVAAIKVILFTFHMFDLDVVIFRHNLFIYIIVVNFAINSDMLQRLTDVISLIMVQMAALKLTKDTVYKCTLIISKHQYTNIVFSVIVLSFCKKPLFIVGNSIIEYRIDE